MSPREAFMCPFCRTHFPSHMTVCSGSFLDRDHPSAVRPILVELEDDGSLAPGGEERLAKSRSTYKRSGASG